jgi:hypothetical protein
MAPRIEEFNPTFNYISGHDKTVADALSRVPTMSVSPLLKEKSPNNSRLKDSDQNKHAEMMFHATNNNNRLK